MDKLLSALTLLCIMVSISFSATANEDQQQKLDKACEDDRLVKLEPLRKNIYKECQNLGKNESTCKSEAAAYNGNRINGAPRFYELPSCVQAFEYRNKSN